MALFVFFFPLQNRAALLGRYSFETAKNVHIHVSQWSKWFENN